MLLTRPLVLFSSLAFAAACAAGAGACGSSNAGPNDAGGSGGHDASTDGGDASIDEPDAEPSPPSCQSTGTCDAGDASDAPTDADGGAESCGTCDASSCPAPSAVIHGAPCCNPGLACNGSIVNNCGAPVGSDFQCICSACQWQCEGPDASGAICDAGQE